MLRHSAASTATDKLANGPHGIRLDSSTDFGAGLPLKPTGSHEMAARPEAAISVFLTMILHSSIVEHCHRGRRYKWRDLQKTCY
jgi:hypothetical protein